MGKRVVCCLAVLSLSLAIALTPAAAPVANAAAAYAGTLDELARFADKREIWWSDSPGPYYTIAFHKPAKSGEAYRLTLGYHSPSSEDDVWTGTVKMTSASAGIFSYKLRNGNGKILHDGKLNYANGLLTLIYTDANNDGERIAVVFRHGVQLLYRNGSSVEPIPLGQPPLLSDGRVLVPMRGLFEFLGADVVWKNATRTVLAEKGDMKLELTLGGREAKVNGRSITLDVPARSVNGSVMVPLRFVSETLQYGVGWNDSALTATIVEPEKK